MPMRKRHRSFQIIPVALLALASLYVLCLHRFVPSGGKTPLDQAASSVIVTPPEPRMSATLDPWPQQTRLPVGPSELSSGDLNSVEEDIRPDEFDPENNADETSIPNADLVASPSLELSSRDPKSLRFYVHSLSNRFDAEKLVKKHPKCSVFQWSNDLKFLRHVRGGKVDNPSSADFFLVPFLSKCYFNFEAKYLLDRMERDFNQIVEELEATEAWKKWPDRHIFIFSSGVGPTLIPSWRRVRRGIFILAEGDRSSGFYESSRDIVIPGVGKATKGQISSLDLHRPRRLLATFRGTLIRGHARDRNGKSVYCRSLLRQALLNMAVGRADVAINDRRYTDNQGTLDKSSYKKELADSTFCIIPRGLTPWTSRLFDAIALDCIPVILSNAIVFPYERSIDYSQFTIKLPESWVGRLWTLLESIPKADVRALQKRVRSAAPMFLGKGPIDAVVAELAKVRSGAFRTNGTKNSMTTFWTPGRGTFELNGNEARQVGPSYSAGAEPHPSELWAPDDKFKKLVGNLWHEENCVPCPKCKFGQWLLK